MKKVAIGCGSVALALILVVGVVAVIKGPQWFRKGMDLVEREMRGSESLNGWNPASDTPGALFPSQVGTATLVSTAPSGGVDALDIVADGQSAVYELAADRVVVHVFPVTENERVGLLSLANAAYDRSSGAKSSVQINSRTQLKFPAGSFVLAQPPARTVVFVASRGTDLTEFVEGFFASQPAAGEPADPPLMEDVSPPTDVEPAVAPDAGLDEE
jgi:hypothetical protein